MEPGFINSIPPVTRMYLGGIIATTVGLKLDWIRPLQIYFNPELILQGEYWRLLSSFFFFGGFNLHFLFNVLFIYRYCKNLEEENYRGKTADFIVFFVLSASLVLIIALVANMQWLGMAFTQVFVYVWSRRNPYTLLNFLGFIIRAPFLPWVFMAFSLVLGGQIMDDVIGIIVGHMYYFLEDVFPNQDGGFKILITPEFLKRMFNDNYRPPETEEVESTPIPAQEGDNDNPGGYNFGGDDNNGR